MKKSHALLIVVLSLLIMLTGCIKDNSINSGSNISFQTGTYHDKNWDETVGTSKEDCVPTKEIAIDIASAVLSGLQSEGYYPNYTVQHVFFDEPDQIWIVSFWEKREELYTGDCWSIAMRKSDAKILRGWAGE